MYTCPECGREGLERRDLCWCGADVSLLSAMEAALDAWHNAGVAAAEAGDYERALEWFAACAVARPSDAGALTLLAKLWLRLGHPGAALRALDRATELEPETTERSALRAMALGSERDAAGRPAEATLDSKGEHQTTPPGDSGQVKCKSTIERS